MTSRVLDAVNCPAGDLRRVLIQLELALAEGTNPGSGRWKLELCLDGLQEAVRALAHLPRK